MYKKIIAGIALAAAAAVPASANQSLRFINNGGIVLDGSIDGIRKDQNVTITVTDYELEWTDADRWSGGDGSGIVYYDDCKAEEEGKYRFKFALENSGVYNAYIGTEVLSTPQKTVFEYIDADKNAAAVAEITASGADIAGILQNKRNDLGLFTKAFEQADIDSAAKILGATLAGADTPNTESMIELAEKALLASAFTSRNISNINDYTDVVENDEIFSYYNSDISGAVTGMLSGKSYADVKDFDKKLKDAVILSTVNNSGNTERISNILNDYADYIPINKNKITTQLCAAAANNGSFSDIASLSDFAARFRQQNTQGSSGSGGAGGTSSGDRNNYNDATVEIPKNDGTKTEEYSVFSDISGVAWAKDAITNLYYKGIISGRTETEFFPNDPVKREEFAKMLTGALNTELVGDDFPFTDVSPEDWCYKYVKTVYLAGITSGISDSVFGKGMNITRQDLCTMVYKGMKACDIEIPERNEPVSFLDDGNIAEYAKEAAAALQRAGIISGDDKGYFNPNNSATRAEAARIVYSVMSCAAKK